MCYKYGHKSFNILQSKANNGVPPKRFPDFYFPICAACLYLKAIKRPCKTKKPRSINESKPVASVGDFVYFDVLVSSNTGLVYHMSGFIIRQHYQYAYVFVDHCSDFTYAHLLKSKTGD